MPNVEMLEGIARGGPRNGVKLSAPHKWDGRVAKSGGGKLTGFHPGRYIWSYSNSTWRWSYDQVKTKTATRPPKSYA